MSAVVRVVAFEFVIACLLVGAPGIGGAGVVVGDQSSVVLVSLVAAQKALIHKRAMTPAAKPPKSPSISPSVQARLDEAARSQPSVDLGVLGGGSSVVDEAAASAMAHVDDFAQALPSFAMPAGGAVPQVRGLVDDISAAGARSCLIQMLRALPGSWLSTR